MKMSGSDVLKAWRPYILLLLAAAIMVSKSSYADQFDLSGFGAQTPERFVEVAPLFSVSSAQAGGIYDAVLILDIARHWHINSDKPYEEWLIAAELNFDTTAALIPQAIAYPPAHDIDLADSRMSVFDGHVIIRFQVRIAADATPGDYLLPLRFSYQPCNDKECRAPQTESLELPIRVGSEGEAIRADIFPVATAVTQFDEPAKSPVAADNDLQRLINKYGFWGYFIALGLAFLTGLLLSFSPCTYPMIPVVVSVFAGQQRSLGRGFIMSLFYVGSMAVVYGIMGLVVSLVGGVFGAWLASPPVVIGIAVVFVIFALSMFGLYELQMPFWLRQKLGIKAATGGIGGVILLGIIAALVISPCVGPFVAGILLYIATSGSPVLGFLVLFVFALGLGTLYVIIGTFSSAINNLPGSGKWMESVKKFFGFVLLLMAIYFLRTIIPPVVTALLTGLLLVVFGVFGGGLDRLTKESKFFARLQKLLGIIALLIGLYLLLGTLLMQGLILPPATQWLPLNSTTDSGQAEELIAWDTDLRNGLARAAAESKPVLIDTWATWCVNCKVLEKNTFYNQEVAAEAKRFVPIKVQLEKAGSVITKDFMARFGLKHHSLPTTLLLDSKGNVHRIIRGVVGPDEMIAAMREVH